MVLVNNLFLILFLICFVTLIVGLIKPNAVVKFGAVEKRNRKSVLKYYGIGLIVFFVLFGVTIDSSQSNQAQQTTNTVTKQKVLSLEEKAAADKEAAADIDAKILALGDINSLILDNSSDVKSIDVAYQRLTQDQKGLVTKYDILTSAQKKINDLQAAADKAAADKAAAEKAAADKAAAEKAAAEKIAEIQSYDTGISYNQLARTPDNYKDEKVTFTGKVLQVIENSSEINLRIAVNDNYDTVIFVGYDPKITSIRVLENDYVTIRGKSIGIYSYESTLGGQISVPGIWVDYIKIN